MTDTIRIGPAIVQVRDGITRVEWVGPYCHKTSRAIDVALESLRPIDELRRLACSRT